MMTILMLVTGLAVASCDDTVVKRSDDVPPLENVVQQQAVTIQNLQTELAALKTKMSSMEAQQKPVAFHVRFIQNWGPSYDAGQHGILRFNRAITNIGNGFNTETGVFNVPVSGTYLFILGAMTGKDYGELSLMKTGGVVLGLTFNKQPDGVQHLRDTTQAVVHLQAGEQVWVEQAYGTTAYQQYWATIFTGMLIQAD